MLDPSPAARTAAGLLLGLAAALSVTLAAYGSEPKAKSATADAPSEIQGWQGLRVASLEGKLRDLCAGDVDGDGRPELLIPNPRRGRIEVFQWLPADERLKEINFDPENPNFLPMAPEFSRSDISIDEVPRGVLPHDLDGDGKDEVLVLISRPLRILAYSRQGESWKKIKEYRLQEGTLSSTEPRLLARPGTQELYLSFREGIQVLDLSKSDAGAWMPPKSRQKRDGWWFGDLDGDSDDDLVAWSTLPASVHWFENVDGRLLSSIELSDQALIEVVPYRRTGMPAELMAMRKTQPGVLKRYRLNRGDTNAVGSRRRLSLPENTQDWASVTIENRTAIVYPDPSQPRLVQVYLEDSGWSEETTFPIVSDVIALAAPLSKPGTLLLRSKDASDLHVSTWEQGRLTYPRPMPPTATPPAEGSSVEGSSDKPEGDRKILALETAGSTTWWAQRVGSHLDLYLWGDNDAEPRRLRFEGVAEKVEKVEWLGGKSVLVMEQYAAQPKMLRITNDGKTEVVGASRLKKISLDDLHLVRVGPAECPSGPGGPYLARIADGVLQWLDKDLYPIDQVMLPNGKRLVNYVVLGNGNPWALEQGGSNIHRMEPDEAGILRVAESVELPGAKGLVQDSRLGLILVGSDSLTQLSPGRPQELELVEGFEPEITRTAGSQEPKIHRIASIDLDGNGTTEAVCFDDIRREITAYGTPKDEIRALLTWRVYDDKTYPYGGASGRDRIAEPRALFALDFDADGHQDLAMICHERLLIYLGREGE